MHTSAWAWTGRRPADDLLVSSAPDGADEGFTLLETLVSLALITVLMTALSPFFTGWLRTSSAQRDRQVAIQLADDAMERARALGRTGLLDGRSRVAVQGQWAQAPEAVRTAYATAMLCDWDPKLSSEAAAACDGSATVNPTAAGAQAPLPTVPVAVTVAGVRFQQHWYVGRCWLQPTSPNATCTSTGVPGHLPFVRVVIAVTWPDQKCSGGICVYQTTTLISAATDPVFNLWG
jgi:prepilin-type N-terminal cleavage/methylation domain-containing protein